MNQAELIKKLSEATGITQTDCKNFTVALADIVMARLNVGEEITLPGIGKLKIQNVAARTGRNPSTGEAVEISAKRRIKFSVSKNLKDYVNH